MVPEGEMLITSDNPALWYSINESGNVHFMILPITPECCAIAYDEAAVSVHGYQLSKKDVTVLNLAQSKSMLTALYSCAAFPEGDRTAAPDFWKRHQAPKGFIDDMDWQMNVLRYPGSLSCVQSTPNTDVAEN